MNDLKPSYIFCAIGMVFYKSGGYFLKLSELWKNELVVTDFMDFKGTISKVNALSTP